jgi:hypothetical protein
LLPQKVFMRSGSKKTVGIVAKTKSSCDREQLAQLATTLNMDWVDIAEGYHNTIRLKYSVQSPNIEQILWQLPHISPFDYTIWIDEPTIRFNTTKQAVINLCEQHSIIPLISQCVVDIEPDDSYLIPFFSITTSILLFKKTEEVYLTLKTFRIVEENWTHFSVAVLPRYLRQQTRHGIAAVSWLCGNLPLVSVDHTVVDAGDNITKDGVYVDGIRIPDLVVSQKY